jgi:hypothetical protein
MKAFPSILRSAEDERRRERGNELLRAHFSNVVKPSPLPSDRSRWQITEEATVKNRQAKHDKASKRGPRKGPSQSR